MIPEWSMAGIIPPVRPDFAGHDVDRSPYNATLTEVIQRFVLSHERAQIMQGLLNYRAELHAAEIVNGFQWLDGSFMENVEDLEGRAPRDVDVVTFIDLNDGRTQADLDPVVNELFDPEVSKQNYHVDGYPFFLNGPMNQGAIRRIAYWYSMWSHRRNGLWKGFVQVELNPAFDIEGQLVLNQIVANGFEP